MWVQPPFMWMQPPFTATEIEGAVRVTAPDIGSARWERERLATPTADPLCLWELGMHGIPLTQYVRWADDVGIIAALADERAVTVDEIAAATSLTPGGADALLGVLCGLDLVRRTGERFSLACVAREYLDRRSPFYVGGSLYGMLQTLLPPQLRKGQPVRRYSRFTGTMADRIRYWRKPNQFGRQEQLASQHGRNLPMAVIAARGGHFDGIRHLADIGGGTGAFAIPLVLRDPRLRVTLVELPRALPHISPYLRRYGVHDRVTLLGFNVHRPPWPLAGCDGVLLANFMHFCDDDECLTLLRESCRVLPVSGRLLIHEMLWNDQRDGPLVTALWNFWMTTISSGRQRTRSELAALLHRAGFDEPAVVPTAGGFSLLVSRKIRDLATP
jgi:ubiquinone/menaquinone biosynthesis C-methylase UbiE